MTRSADDILSDLGQAASTMPDSPATFPDGGRFRVEIPSVEGVAAFETVLETSDRMGVPVHRISQGSGIGMLLDSEIAALSDLGAASGVEVCLFVGPRGPWEGTGASLVPDGRIFGWRHTRVEQLRLGLEDVRRAASLGLRSVLVGDEGLIHLIAVERAGGRLPEDLVVKASAMLGIANPVGARMVEDAGADSLNVASDIPVAELAAMRRICDATLDLYVESPDSLGGFVRQPELPEIVRVASPTYLKFGLRNAPNIYPSGLHLEQAVLASARERVRRAAIGMEIMARAGRLDDVSPTGGDRPGVPAGASGRISAQG